MTSLKTQIENFEFHPEVYVYPTPRTYTSKLTKAEFTKDLNVYIHIPFCKQACTYCGYLKIVNSDLQETYLDALLKEIKTNHSILKNNIKTLHFGGGTPSLLSTKNLKQIIDTISNINPNILNTADEMSIEATPESINYKKFSEFKKLGINRVSMGLQTLVDSEIKLCKRNNFSKQSIEAINILRKVGIPNLVLDLMIGIEGQTVESFKHSITSLIKHRPETVELYAVGLMPNTRIKTHNLMTKKEIYECYDIGRKLFLDAGYHQDCHNRYVIPNKGSFFQEDYLFQGLSLIGFGAGARTYAKNIHYRNNYSNKAHKKAILEYIDDINNNKSPIKSAIILTENEKMRQYIIYNIESLDKKEFRRKFNISFQEQFPQLHQDLTNLNLIQEDWRRISLTTKGLNFRDLICKHLFSENVRKLEEEYRPK
ncbi:coproporphyrinogen III oxidase family protein [Candidatus Woesearchaeota archaeon]|jgi:oxygen-independent coproporphyrinogen III oxidase|nr:coproporphyrinogen III oxidase family protein [Candidatus Woesearchaeota archaeon]MBT6518510.1 coproporphyrinogen III oxidase family protein [Candidatus Woesearchaeota archaeon]MBT7368663.1 coproporphyrinogen III oxidase family protein [Candidatus Woesearchaeota archaeon]